MRYLCLAAACLGLCSLPLPLRAQESQDTPGIVSEVKDERHILIQVSPPPAVGDRLEVHAEIPGLDLTLPVAEGKVVSLDSEFADVELTKIDSPVIVGYTIKVFPSKSSPKTPVGKIPPQKTSPKDTPLGKTTPQKPPLGNMPRDPAIPITTRKRQPPPPTKPQPPANGKVVISFNQLPPGQLESDAFSEYGISEILCDESQPLIFEAGEATVLPPGRQNLFSAGAKSDHTSLLTLRFAGPLKRFEFVRIGVLNGASLPKWKLKAFDPAGELVGTVGESDWGFDPRHKRFIVSSSKGIAEILIEADNRWNDTTFATHSALPLAEMVLVPMFPAPPVEPRNNTPPGLDDVPSN